MNKLKKSRIKISDIFILASLEGFIIMALELLIGKSIEPFFGSSLPTWTQTIALTMFFMSIGYFVGGYFCKKKNIEQTLNYLLMVLTLGVAIDFLILQSILPLAKILDHFTVSNFVTLFLLLFIPITSLASIPPILIQLLEKRRSKDSAIIGRIFSISALSGVISTLLFGFIFIELFGVSNSLLLIFVICLLALFMFYGVSKYNLLTLLLSAGIYITSLAVNSDFDNDTYTIVHSSEGLLGKIEVIDQKHHNGIQFDRILNVNNIPQSVIKGGDLTVDSKYKYVHIVSSISTMLERQKDILLCGLAGGALVNELLRFDHNLDVVDIDKRMLDVSSDHFYLNAKKINFFEDDARHFIRKVDKKYDMIILDISASENQPTYLYTLENFLTIKSKLKRNGLFVINFQSHLEKNKENPGYLVYQTLLHSGFKPKIIGNQINQMDDLIFVSKLNQEVNFSSLDPKKFNTCCLQNKYSQLIFNPKHIFEFPLDSDSVYLVDDRPILEYLKKDFLITNRHNIIKNAKKF